MNAKLQPKLTIFKRLTKFYFSFLASLSLDKSSDATDVF
jgi:hypothetical protein